MCDDVYGVTVLFGFVSVIVSTLTAETMTSSDISVSGIVGDNVHLPCSLSYADQYIIEWVDFVYNSDHDPQKIFSSENNSVFAIDASHRNAHNYVVQTDFTLVISNINYDDSGQYVCRDRRNSTVQVQQSYYLNVGSKYIITIMGFWTVN
jgi:Immunoglobulin V-set domain